MFCLILLAGSLLDDPAVRKDLGVTSPDATLTAARERRLAQLELQDAGVSGLLEVHADLGLSVDQLTAIGAAIRHPAEAVGNPPRDATAGQQAAYCDRLEAARLESHRRVRAALTPSQRAAYLRKVGPPVAGRPGWADPMRPRARASRPAA